MNAGRLKAGLLILASCAGQSPATAPESQLPTLPANDAVGGFSSPEIEVSLPDADGTFHFKYCWGIKYRPQVLRVIVLPFGERLGEPSDHLCTLKTASAGLRSEWKYGSTPPGSKIGGPCAPFRVGEAYSAVFSGSGSGWIDFRFTAQGPVAIGESHCSRRR